MEQLYHTKNVLNKANFLKILKNNKNLLTDNVVKIKIWFSLSDIAHDSRYDIYVEIYIRYSSLQDVNLSSTYASTQITKFKS